MCNVTRVAPWVFKSSVAELILEKMKEYGIEEGKGIAFVEQLKLSMAVAKTASDESI